jgi:hypothetical protein
MEVEVWWGASSSSGQGWVWMYGGRREEDKMQKEIFDMGLPFYFK